MREKVMGYKNIGILSLNDGYKNIGILSLLFLTQHSLNRDSLPAHMLLKF